MPRCTPDWFAIGDSATAKVMQRIADAVTDLSMKPQVRSAPMLAHWFLCDSLLLANQANKDGMHANALSLTRQCLEALSIIELGVCRHPEAEATLFAWNDDRLSPGKLRAWLERNVWPQYGCGLWIEPWSTFMRELAGAIQPYAHYGACLAQWQVRLIGAAPKGHKNEGHAIIEMRPRAYDAQKATRIALFHVLLTFALGRIWIAANPTDTEFAALINRLRIALGKSHYLDGSTTEWSRQFWAMMWKSDGGTLFE